MRRPAALAERGDRLQMLAREQLGRRHQRALRSRLDRAGKREQRHHGLAAADIALQQAQHAVRAREVGVDLGEGALLCAGELEGELGEDRLAQFSRSAQAAGPRASSCAGGSRRARADWRAARRKRAACAGRVVGARSASPSGACRRCSASPNDGQSFRARNGSSIHSGSGGSSRERLADRLAQHRVGEACGQRIKRLMDGQGDSGRSASAPSVATTWSGWGICSQPS